MEMITPEMPERNDGHMFAAAPVYRVLGPKGIEVNSLHYVSPELADLCLRLGDQRLKVKPNPDDLGFIYVLHPESNTYFKAMCTWPQYATGMTQKQHKSFRRRLREAHKALQSKKRALLDAVLDALMAHQQRPAKLDKHARKPLGPQNGGAA